MSDPVFLTAAGQLERVGVGDVVLLGGAEARHAVQVMRLRAGEPVELVDGCGWRLTGTVVEPGLVGAAPSGRAVVPVASFGGAPDAGPELAVSVTSCDWAANSAAGLVLVQGLAKGGRDEQAVEAAVELGVSAVVPWQSNRCVVRWPAARAERQRQRWQAICAREVKVSRRAWLPTVHPVTTTDQLVRALSSQSDFIGHEILVLHEAASRSFLEVAGGLRLSAPIVLIVGPEGGIAPQEIEALEGVDARTVRLGQAILRASTAAPAALAALAAVRRTWP